MYGVLAAYLRKAHPEFWRRLRYRLPVAGLAALSGVWIYLVKVGFDTWMARTLLFSVISLGAAFLLPFCDQWKISKETAVTISFRKTALWSYSLYLCHARIFIVVGIVVQLLGLQASPGVNIAAWLCAFVLSFVVAALLYRYFEKPIMGLRERHPILVSGAHAAQESQGAPGAAGPAS
jgi:peptidoglycan/LPS O-acetylase OafA/YrhL